MNRLLFVADVSGPATYHVGDEAMLEANLDGFRARLPAFEATVVSSDPEWSARQFGAKAIRPIGFPDAARASDDERHALLERLLADAERGRDSSDLVRAVAGTDGVVISGGGNLSSTWPEHVFERVAVGALARRMGKPVVLLGQTIGPDVSARLRPLLSELLRSAALVGVRELPSAALALALGVPGERLVYQTDDALFLNSVPVDEPWVTDLTEGGPWVAVTLDRFATGRVADSALAALAHQLARLADRTGARLAFIPHVAERDAAVGRELAAHLPATAPLIVCPLLEARRARWLTARADLIVSTRYHPLVFGLAAGRPCVGLVTDEYRRTKLRGALVHADLPECCLSMESAVRGGLFETAAEQWARRAAVGHQLANRRERWRAAEEVRWQRVCAALGFGAASAPAPSALLDCGPLDVVPVLLGELEARGAFAAELARVEAARHGELERYAASLEAERGRFRDAAGESERYALSLRDELDKLRATCAESERYALSLRDELDKLRATCAESERYALSLRDELSKVRTASASPARHNSAA